MDAKGRKRCLSQRIASTLAVHWSVAVLDCSTCTAYSSAALQRSSAASNPWRLESPTTRGSRTRSLSDCVDDRGAYLTVGFHMALAREPESDRGASEGNARKGLKDTHSYIQENATNCHRCGDR